MTGAYPGEERALARVRTLQQHGTWPGVIRYPDGSCSLTSDPGAAPAQEDE